MRKIIFALIIITMLVGVGFTEFPPPPEDDSCCDGGWYPLFYIANSKYCNGGDYYLWHCKELGGKDILYTSVCLSSIQVQIYTVYFPMVRR